MQLRINDYIINTPLIDILNDVKLELTNGKLSTLINKGNTIQVTCPNINHSNGCERHPSCGIYCGEDEKKYGLFNCFTCKESGPFYHFIALCFDTTDEKAKKWLISKYGELEAKELQLNLEPIILNTYKPKVDISLDSFQSWHPYLDKRHLSKEVCEKFQVKYDPKTECIVFPVYDEHNNLALLTRRSVNSKMFLIDKDIEKPIYLLNFIKQHNIDEVTVVESQINCLTLWSWHIPSIATFGCNITKHQFELFNKSSIRHYYLAFDGDMAGKKGIITFLKNIRKDVLVDIILLPSNKDVNDLTYEQFNNLKIENSIDYLKNNCILN